VIGDETGARTGSGASAATEARPVVRAAIVDYGAGNLVSIGQALAAVGADVRIATGPQGLDDVDLLVVPGVGAAAPAMERLRVQGLVEPIRAWARADRPFLGICLGLQLLFEGSDEDGAETLGILPGRTVRLDAAPTLPHIGWNQVVRRRDHEAFAGIPDGADLYFVHSYVGRPAAGAPELILAETSHGVRFASAVARGRLLGVQFHPERSGTDGLRLLANVVAAVRVAVTAASVA
jgi:imidazole glycerol phosphate synthase glutamine amidotransferase subunit